MVTSTRELRALPVKTRMASGCSCERNVRRLCLGRSSAERGKVAPVASHPTYSTSPCTPRKNTQRSPQAIAFGNRQAGAGPSATGADDDGDALTYVPLVPAEPRHVTIRLAGEHDLSTAPEIAQRIEAALQSGATCVCVNLEAVTFLDASVLGALVRGRSRCADHDAKFVVTCSEQRTRRVFAIAKLATLLQDHD